MRNYFDIAEDVKVVETGVFSVKPVWWVSHRLKRAQTRATARVVIFFYRMRPRGSHLGNTLSGCPKLWQTPRLSSSKPFQGYSEASYRALRL